MKKIKNSGIKRHKGNKQKFIIIGVPFDNGIRSMLRFGRGIIGASDGPKAVFDAWDRLFAKKYPKVKRRILNISKFNLKVTPENINKPVFHKKQKAATLKAHDLIRQTIRNLCKKGYIPISIGGDHSVSYPLCLGLKRTFSGKKIGVIYIDSHFDMRDFDLDKKIGGVISSGNPFRRLIDGKRPIIKAKNVIAIGIHNSGSAIYRKMKRYAIANNVMIIHDNEIGDADRVVKKALSVAGNGTDLICFSIDIDAVSEKFAPGVSAPAHDGISDKQLFKIVSGIAKDNRVMAFDITEISSRKLTWQEVGGVEFKNELEKEKWKKLNKTAKLAAKITDLILKSKMSRH